MQRPKLIWVLIHKKKILDPSDLQEQNNNINDNNNNNNNLVEEFFNKTQLTVWKLS